MSDILSDINDVFSRFSVPMSEVPPKLYMLDEAHYLFSAATALDSIKELLRSIDGVPNASYVVKPEGVFVFDKLVAALAEKEQDFVKADPDSQRNIALAHLPAAIVSPGEAVEQWKIVPNGYELTGDEKSGFSIRHRPLNAEIPGNFTSRAAAQKVLAVLLVGGTHQGAGDFSFKGQPYRLREALDSQSLPPRPVFRLDAASVSPAFLLLDRAHYVEGLAPLSREIFETVQQLEAAWEQDHVRAASSARREADRVWLRVNEIPFERLNTASGEEAQCDNKEVAELRSLYPELHALTDATLHGCYDDFQTDCHCRRGWDVYRDDSFLFYLLGLLANPETQGEWAQDMGEMIAYSLLDGSPIVDALAFGQAWGSYARAIGSLARRIASALEFLAETQQSTDLKGHEIRVFRDMFRIGRISSPKLINVTQTISEFGNIS